MEVVADIKDVVTEAREARNRGDYQAAQVLLNKAYSENPQDPRIWFETGVLRMTAREHKEALKLFTASHEAFTIAHDLSTKAKDKKAANRDRALSAYSAALCCNTLGEYETAEAWLEIATALNPTASNLNAYGSTLYMLGKHTEGFLAHDRALRCAAKDPQDRMALALTKMLRGDQSGFADYEARFELPAYRPHRTVDLPRWTGVEVGRVLVVSEQGLGDSIMMERYLKHIPSYCVSVQPELRDWFISRGHPTLPIGVGGTALEHSDYWVPMMSLPSIFGIVPPESPSIAMLVKQASPRSQPRVGLCWKGNPEHSNDLDRSAPFAWMADVFDSRVKAGWLAGIGADWVSLQYGVCGFEPKDFLETARIIEGLDAVVTVDTAIAHMAGTLGVPTILIPPTSPEWRWGIPIKGQEVCKSVWYPSVTIVRRRESKAWPEAIEQVSKILKEML